MSRLINLTGQTIGRRTVLRRADPPKPTRWIVRCECGQINTISSQNMRAGNANGCRSCAATDVTNNREDLTGTMFGVWRAISPTRKRKRRAWLVECHCGSRSTVTTSDLKCGHSTQCKSCAATKTRYTIDLNDRDWCWLLGLFHGDGNTYFPTDGGGTVTFAAAPPENRIVILKAFSRVGVKSVECGKTVAVYSVDLTRKFARFKVSGIGIEQWMFPEQPLHMNEWLAGLLDADGCVTRDGSGITYYQKPHGGMDKVATTLDELGVAYTRRVDKVEILRISAKSRMRFAALVKPRFKKKRIRLARAKPTRTRLIDIKGERFGSRIVLRRDANATTNVRWIVICDCGRQDSALSQLREAPIRASNVVKSE